MKTVEMETSNNYRYEELNKEDLRFMPIGTKENMFEHLQQLSPNQMRLLMCIQEVSRQDELQRKYSTPDSQTRYVDLDMISMRSIYKKINISEPTGISCLKKLKELGWIKEIVHTDVWGYKRRYLIIRNSVASNDFWTKCSLNTDLYRLVKKGCRPIVVKVYLYHCFQGGMNKDKGYKYSCSLKQIAHAVGCSKTNLQQIIDANDLLWELGVIDIDKKWIKINETQFHQSITYKYNHLYRTRRQLKAIEQQIVKEEDINDWCPW